MVFISLYMKCIFHCIKIVFMSYINCINFIAHDMYLSLYIDCIYVIVYKLYSIHCTQTLLCYTQPLQLFSAIRVTIKHFLFIFLFCLFLSIYLFI